jgi:hypothetical protein
VDFRLADAGSPHRLPNGRDRWRDGLHAIEEDNARWVPPDSDRTVALVCDHIGVPLTEEAIRRMSAELGPAFGRRDTATGHGLTAEGLDERFATYCEAFALR